MLYPLLVLASFGPSRLAAECFKAIRTYPATAMNISALRAHDDLEEHRMEIWRATAPLRGFPPHVYSGWKGGVRPSGTGQRMAFGGLDETFRLRSRRCAVVAQVRSTLAFVVDLSCRQLSKCSRRGRPQKALVKPLLCHRILRSP